MRDSKSTKRALAASIGCVALCSAMLVGTTFAWFTDTATTNVSKIQAGTLDVDLVDKEGKSVDGKTLSFIKAADGSEEQVLWEPGCTYELPAVYVKNNGTLALKYKIEITGIKGDGQLNEAIEWTVNGEGIDEAQSLAAEATSGPLTIKGHMKEDADNKYQGLSMDGITISVTATQDTVEHDSTTNQYDVSAGAIFATPVSTKEDLETALANGGDVLVSQDINLASGEKFEIDKSVSIYGDGQTKLVSANGKLDRIINVNSPDSPAPALEDITLTLSGVNLEGSTANGDNRAISIWGVVNPTVIMDNCNVTANHYAFNFASDNTNAKATVLNSTLTGYSAFQTWSPTTATFENCTLTGLNDFGGGDDNYATIVLTGGATDVNLTFKNCRIVATEKQDPEEKLLRADAGTSGTVTFEGCTFVHNDKELTTQDEINKYIFIRDGSSVNVVFK